jgi:RNA polymerase sigma-70 factor (ECF subfamily)
MIQSPKLQVIKNSDQQSKELSDDDLMQLVMVGRQDAFEILIQRHQQLVLGLAIRYLGDSSKGRDVAQDVFLSIWAERNRYKPKGKFRSYLVAVTINRCHVFARQERSNLRKISNFEQSTLDVQHHNQKMPLDKLVEAERAKEVRSKLTKLSCQQRQVLILRYTHEMSLEEIASLTDLPLGTVKSHLFRGMKRLHRLFTEDRS